MCELVLLIIPVLEVDEDAQVMRSCDHTHARASKLGAQLVVPLCTDTLLGAVDVEGGNWRVEGAEFGVFRVGCVSSTFQLHCKCQY